MLGSLLRSTKCDDGKMHLPLDFIVHYFSLKKTGDIGYFKNVELNGIKRLSLQW